ncbi:MAG: bacterioferritin [Proteobacteria bacterium]|nr:bacterioferritin [Pseudomonadota bacterium]
MSREDREKRRSNVIEVLNKARAMELKAIHQYMNQHFNMDDMDYGELAVKLKLIAIDEMRHSEMFAERIKELGGEPTADPTGPIEKRQKVEAVYSFNAQLEDDTVDTYNQFVQVCRENGDSISMKLFETIIDEEQLHYNYFDNVAEHIENLGNTYLANIAGTPSASGLQPSGFVVSQKA